MTLLKTLRLRGLLDAVTSLELEALLEKSSIRVYAGFDPTADSLHLGNLIGIVMLKWFQKFGHTPYVILGGATGRIGDPGGKSVERPLLSEETIRANIQGISRHFSTMLDYAVPNKPVILNNDDWLKNYSFIDFLRDVGKHFRVQAMLAKESVRTRLDSEEGISFTEFSYQLLQAYDYYHLFTSQHVILQMGGSDQWGNITAGIELIRRLSAKEAFGLTWHLLTRSDGKKFGKTEGGAIWLASEKYSPYQFYQYLIGVPDADVIKMMRMLTFVSLEEIEEMEEQMQRSSYVPNTLQKRLAKELTLFVHGEEGFKKAIKATEAAMPGGKADLNPEALKEIAASIPNHHLSSEEVMGQKFVDLAVKVGLGTSKGEIVRLIKNGGAYLNDEKIEDVDFKITQNQLIGGTFLLFASGKKKKILLQISKK